MQEMSFFGNNNKKKKTTPVAIWKSKANGFLKNAKKK